MSSFGSVAGALWKKYQEIPSKLKVIDVYLAYILFTGAIQFLYCLLVGTFPFNSFLSGFISCVATFVLTVSLRMQVDPTGVYKGENQERAFADWLLANAVLHIAILAFLG